MTHRIETAASGEGEYQTLTTVAERAELVALLDLNAANHIAYSEAIGTKDERRAKQEWKRSSDRMEVFAVGYLRKLVKDVDGLVAARGL